MRVTCNRPGYRPVPIPCAKAHFSHLYTACRSVPRKDDGEVLNGGSTLVLLVLQKILVSETMPISLTTPILDTVAHHHTKVLPQRQHLPSVVPASLLPKILEHIGTSACFHFRHFMHATHVQSLCVNEFQ
jgi:hypothetical protein